MAKRTTRREVLAGGVASTVALLLSSTASGQAASPSPDVERIEKQLAQPLTEQARKLTTAALASAKDTSEQRRKFKLPENSEPSFTFAARDREKRSW